MKYYTFFRESNKFDDILKDPIIKKYADEIVRWHQHLSIGFYEDKNIGQNTSYITLKYGDEMKTDVIKDFSPVPGVDYIPKKDISKFKKSIS